MTSESEARIHLSITVGLCRIGCDFGSWEPAGCGEGKVNNREKRLDEVPTKVPYASPRLKRLGTLRDLTRTKGGGSLDGGASANQTRP